MNGEIGDRTKQEADQVRHCLPGARCAWGYVNITSLSTQEVETVHQCARFTAEGIEAQRGEPALSSRLSSLHNAMFLASLPLSLRTCAHVSAKLTQILKN